METLYTRAEPIFERGPLLPLGQDQNPVSQFTENNRINGQVPLMVLHSVSVGSDSMGAKKPFCGQASSQSTAPSFCGGARRTSR